MVPGALCSDVVAGLRYLAEVIINGCSSGRFAVSGASPWSSELRIWPSVDMNPDIEQAFELPAPYARVFWRPSMQRRAGKIAVVQRTKGPGRSVG